MDPPSVRIRPSPHPATRAFGIFGRSVARPVVALFVLLILALASDFRSAPSEPSLIHQRLVPLPSGAPRAAVTRHRRVKGEVLINLAGKERVLAEGDVQKVSPGVLHSFAGKGPALLLELSMPCEIADNDFENPDIPMGRENPCIV